MITNIKQFKIFLERKEYKVINEGQFSWYTQNTNQQIGSEKTNTINVYMYDNKGNSWNEPNYQGYGVFGGKDYYDLLAEMNGYTIEEANGKDLRQYGIDIEFNKLNTKNEDGIVLYPALISDDANYNYQAHDFTQMSKHDPNQSWEIEYNDNDDDYNNEFDDENDYNEYDNEDDDRDYYNNGED